MGPLCHHQGQGPHQAPGPQCAGTTGALQAFPALCSDTSSTAQVAAAGEAPKGQVAGAQ